MTIFSMMASGFFAFFGSSLAWRRRTRFSFSMNSSLTWLLSRNCGLSAATCMARSLAQLGDGLVGLVAGADSEVHQHGDAAAHVDVGGR